MFNTHSFHVRNALDSIFKYKNVFLTAEFLVKKKKKKLVMLHGKLHQSESHGTHKKC